MNMSIASLGLAELAEMFTNALPADAADPQAITESGTFAAVQEEAILENEREITETRKRKTSFPPPALMMNLTFVPFIEVRESTTPPAMPMPNSLVPNNTIKAPSPFVVEEEQTEQKPGKTASAMLDAIGIDVEMEQPAKGAFELPANMTILKKPVAAETALEEKEATTTSLKKSKAATTSFAASMKIAPAPDAGKTASRLAAASSEALVQREASPAAGPTPAVALAPAIEMLHTFDLRDFAQRPASPSAPQGPVDRTPLIQQAESVQHQRVLNAVAEAHGEIVVPELGRIEVIARQEHARIDVQVKADDEKATRVLAANATQLDAHVRVEVPQAEVRIESSFLGNNGEARSEERQRREDSDDNDSAPTFFDITPIRSTTPSTPKRRGVIL